MAPQTTQLHLPEDLEDDAKATGLAASDRDALRSVSAWVKSFVACPHRDLGRDGTVCPFVPTSLERRVLHFAAEHVGDLDVAGVVDLMAGYKRFFLERSPLDGGDDAMFSTIIVVFPDLPAERAGALFDDVLGQLADSSYKEDGIIFGPFFEGNPGTAIYNSEFRPFQSPVPFLFVRHTVLSDWKFFVEDDELLDRWAQHFGPAAGVHLGEELRGQPWREARR